MSTDPEPSAEAAAERAAMTQIARLWETGADNLEHAIADGASRHLSEVETLRGCAYELRSTLRARRPGAQSTGAGPASNVDPLRHIRVGDPAPLFDGPYCGMGWCTRRPHPEHWQHIVGDDGRVLAVWTDDPQPGSAG